jgi:hypothetical protein
MAALIFSFNATVVSAQAELTITEDNFDFGYVPQNAKVSHKYILESTGTDTLRIVDIRPGCGCTKAPLKKNLLAAGESTELEVIFSTRRYIGQLEKNPIILTDAKPGQQYISFTATVVVNPGKDYPYKIQPYILNYDNLKKDQSKLAFTITNNTETDLKVELIEYDPQVFEIKLPKKIKSGKAAEVEVKLKKESAEENFEKSVTLQFNDEEKTRITVPLVSTRN